MRRSSLSILIFLALVPGAAAQKFNPFGNRGSGGSGYNLGLLGGQAKELSKAEARGIGLKAGQTALQVSSLDAGQPGQAAGLLTGDQIVNLAGRSLDDRSAAVYQLAAAMDAVMSRRSGANLPLGVLRGGRPVKVVVKLPALGPHSSADPRGCRHCGVLLGRSFDFLLKQQKSDGSFPTMMGGNNGAVATAAISGLALLAASRAPSGAMAKAVGKVKEFLLKTTGNESSFGGLGGSRGDQGRGGMGGRGGNWSQVNWSLGYGALFLAEYAARTGDTAVLQKLAWICRQIEANQETGGGWAHGPGGPNALGYTDFAAVTNVVLSGYGAAGRVKIKLKAQTIARAVAYLTGTAGPDGGVGYSQRSGQKGFGDAGRTGGTLLAFALCRQQRNPFFAKMASYFLRNMAKVPEGHASPVHHFGLCSLASLQVTGAWKRFNQQFRYELFSALKPDGSFLPRPSKESASMGMNSDRSTGPCWATGTYLLAWNLPRGNLKLYGASSR